MEQNDIDSIQKLLGATSRDCWSLRDTLREFEGLISRLAHGGKISINEDVACRTCPEWKQYINCDTDEPVDQGMCTHHAHPVHDRMCGGGFFCAYHPFFQQRRG